MLAGFTINITGENNLDLMFNNQFILNFINQIKLFSFNVLAKLNQFVYTSQLKYKEDYFNFMKVFNVNSTIFLITQIKDVNNNNFINLV
jgi:hypothetical protein